MSITLSDAPVNTGYLYQEIAKLEERIVLLETEMPTKYGTGSAIPAATVATHEVTDQQYNTLKSIQTASTIETRLAALEARVTIAPGTILYSASSSSNMPGFLPCDGRVLIKADYLPLYAAIGNTYTYWGGINTSTYFHLPDLRGIYIRGFGTWKPAQQGVEEKYSGFSSGLFGQPALDRIRDHTHDYIRPTGDRDVLTSVGGIAGISSNTGEVADDNYLTYSTGVHQDVDSTRTHYGAETAPFSIALKAYIKT